MLQRLCCACCDKIKPGNRHGGAAVKEGTEKERPAENAYQIWRCVTRGNKGKWKQVETGTGSRFGFHSAVMIGQAWQEEGLVG